MVEAQSSLEAAPMISRESTKVRVTKCYGTSENACIWFNTGDCIGLTFAAVVWGLILFALVTVLLLYTGLDGQTTDVKSKLSQVDVAIVGVLMCLGVWSHIVTMLGDPGTVPWNAHPTDADRKKGTKLTICGHCDSYKPPFAHHDRVSKRCISRMDHFCPWMNNAIGAGNQKNFLLFLIYTGSAAMYLYVLLATHLMQQPDYKQPLLGMVRVLIFVLVFTVMFTVSMVFNQYYGMMTGFGTIDRMKLPAAEIMLGTPVPWSHIFGKFGIHWILPISPEYENRDEVFKYTLKNTRYGQSAL